MIIISVIGSKKSGKTTTIEALVKGLTKRGQHVATVKHVSDPNFTIDIEGKDSWRHTQAGAKTTVIIAAKELTTIKKGDTTKLTIQEIVKNCQNNTDIIILEGFRNLVKQELTIPKIVAIKTFEEAVEASKQFKPIIAFTGPAALTAKKLGTPAIDVIKEPEKLVEHALKIIKL